MNICIRRTYRTGFFVANHFFQEFHLFFSFPGPFLPHFFFGLLECLAILCWHAGEPSRANLASHGKSVRHEYLPFLAQALAEKQLTRSTDFLHPIRTDTRHSSRWAECGYPTKSADSPWSTYSNSRRSLQHHPLPFCTWSL